jgi:putative transposase
MPRIGRQETVYDNSVHHVVQRGLNRQQVFKEQVDYEKFKLLMKRYISEYQVQIYNYCIMPNHVHFLVRITQCLVLARFMKVLFLAYSSYYRYTYKYVGYLWQGRYKNFLIEKDSYLLECARYIERNPLRAKMVENLSDYPWSSFNFYSKNEKDNIITPNPLYESLGRTPRERQRNYTYYVLTPRPYEQALDDIFRI